MLGGFRFPKRPCTAPSAIIACLGLAKWLAGSWQVAQDWPGGSERPVSMNSALPRDSLLRATDFESAG